MRWHKKLVEPYLRTLPEFDRIQIGQLEKLVWDLCDRYLRKQVAFLDFENALVDWYFYALDRVDAILKSNPLPQPRERNRHFSPMDVSEKTKATISKVDQYFRVEKVVSL